MVDSRRRKHCLAPERAADDEISAVDLLFARPVGMGGENYGDLSLTGSSTESTLEEALSLFAGNAVSLCGFGQEPLGYGLDNCPVCGVDQQVSDYAAQPRESLLLLVGVYTVVDLHFVFRVEQYRDSDVDISEQDTLGHRSYPKKDDIWSEAHGPVLPLCTCHCVPLLYQADFLDGSTLGDT